MASRSGFAPPVSGVDVVLLDPSSVGVHHSQSGLGGDVALLRRLAGFGEGVGGLQTQVRRSGAEKVDGLLAVFGTGSADVVILAIAGFLVGDGGQPLRPASVGR